MKRRLPAVLAVAIGFLLAFPSTALANPGNGKGNGQGGGNAAASSVQLGNAENNGQNGNGGKSEQAHENNGQSKKDEPAASEPAATTTSVPEDSVPATQPEAGIATTTEPSSQGSSAAPATAASPVDVKKVDPPGNNGTIKLDRIPFDDHPNNQPHVGCTFQVDFYGFDEGQLYAGVLFELQAPTKDGRIIVNGNVRPFIGEDDHSGGGSEAGLDASETYVLEFVGVTPHPQQGVHVKLTINADGSQGADVKHKVFWVQGCGEQPPPPPPPVETCPDGSTPPPKGNCPEPPPPPVETCPDGSTKPASGECPKPPPPPVDECPGMPGNQPSVAECPPVVVDDVTLAPALLVVQVSSVVFDRGGVVQEVQLEPAAVQRPQPAQPRQLAYTGFSLNPLVNIGLFAIALGAFFVIGSRRRLSKQH